MDKDNNYTDKELFELISDGNEAAFEQLFYRYLPKFKGVIPGIINKETVVNDIIQDIFLNIWISREKLREIVSPSRWMYRVMYNRSLSWLEKKVVRDTGKKVLIQADAGVPVNSNYTEETVLFSETARLVQQAIQQLPPQTQKIYRLSRESGLKIPEIATLLNLSPHSIKNTIVRAGKSVREHLENNGITIPLVLFVFVK